MTDQCLLKYVLLLSRVLWPVVLCRGVPVGCVGMQSGPLGLLNLVLMLAA